MPMSGIGMGAQVGIRESACHSKSKEDFPMSQDVEFGLERRVPRAHAGNGFKDQRKGQ